MTSLVTSFVLFLLLGVPVAFVLGIAAAIHMITEMNVPLSVIPQQLFTGLDQFILMSIPFFILAGYIMNEAQLTGRLIQFANYIVGRWRGGLAQVNVLASMFFGGITGAAAADTAAIGPILIPAMVESGYRRDFSTAVTVASSIIGPLIPPSIPMVVYGVSSGASIGDLFLAGVTPGVLVGISMMALNRFLLRNMPAQQAGEVSFESGGPSGLASFFSSLRVALAALIMPALIVGGVAGGIFTPTESSVAAVVYALIIGFAMRTLGVRSVMPLLAKTAILSAAVMLIIGNAKLLGWVLAFEQIPQKVAEFFLSVTDSPSVFTLLVMILLLITGLFLETSGAIIILTPVLLPAAEAFGLDVVHFGVVMVFGLVIGLITPPVGLCLFIGSSVGKVSFEVLVRATMPYVALLIVVYALLAFVPGLALWLPNLL